MNKLLLVSACLMFAAGVSSCNKERNSEKGRIISTEEMGLVGEWKVVSDSSWGTRDGYEVTFDGLGVSEIVDWRYSFGSNGVGSGSEHRLLSDVSSIEYDFLWEISDNLLKITDLEDDRNEYPMYRSIIPYGFTRTEFEVIEISSERLVLHYKYSCEVDGSQYNVVTAYVFRKV